MAIISLLGLQCVFLPRGGQRLTPVSYFCTAAFFVGPLIALPIKLAGGISWLGFVHVYSYIKIGMDESLGYWIVNYQSLGTINKNNRQ